MEIKIKDEEHYRREKEIKRNEMRREMAKKLKKNSRPYRDMNRRLGDIAKKAKMEHREKYERKLNHLRRKYRGEEEDKLSQIPGGMEEYGDLRISIERGSNK